MAALAEALSADEIASRLELGARLTKQEALARALAIYGEHVRE